MFIDNYSVVITSNPSGGFYAEILEVPDCVVYGDTADEAMCEVIRLKDAWLEMALEVGLRIPVSGENYFVDSVSSFGVRGLTGILRRAQYEAGSLQTLAETAHFSGSIDNKTFLVELHNKGAYIHEFLEKAIVSIEVATAARHRNHGCSLGNKKRVGFGCPLLARGD